MILTCPKCQSQYNLEPAMLGVAGRDVRCVSCGHMWFQIPETAMADVVMTEAAPAEAPGKSIADALNNILEKDDAAFDAVLADVAKSVGKPDAAPKGKAEAVPREAPARPATEEKKQAVVRTELPVVTYNPLGLGATAFGGLVFLLCCFLTLAPLFAAKGLMVRHWPALALFYRTIGFEVKAPGEGLRLSEVTVEKRVDSKSKTLVIEGKMTNMTEKSIAYPALHVTLKDEKDKITREWDLKPGLTDIASGDIAPLLVQLDDVPDDGATVELRVKEE